MLMDGLQPTVDVYNALTSAYGLSGLLDEACCTKVRRFGRIEYILAEMVFLGIECTSVTYNTIIDGYSKAKLFELMESSLTNMIDSETAFPDVFTLGNLRKWRSVMSYNIIIETLGKAGLIKNMEQFFLQMKHEGMKPTSFTYCSLVSAYSRAELLENVDSIMRQVGNSDKDAITIHKSDGMDPRRITERVYLQHCNFSYMILLAFKGLNPQLDRFATFDAGEGRTL
ncbi:hypothetical protein CQW23_28041 [Capsicum baccatum]|uniref:Pentatricopeptide repeat-containing protein n=1 Tax=Capsicum baccatum TaxID=33114 RepID=A0A2G2VFF1_CAPBA|nr:hypothetical protein CQW23_28041 [Capsicum baccatum]